MSMTVDQWYNATMSRGIPQDSCLLWDGYKNENGYGCVRVPPELADVLGIAHRSPALVHRAMYAYHHILGKANLMDTDPIDHQCCNRACYNISHLRHVSHAVNQRHSVDVRMYGRPSEWEEENDDGWL